jgi:hypothetical protein
MATNSEKPTVLRTTMPTILPPFGRSAVADYAVLTRLDAASVHSCLPFVVSLLQRTDEARPRGRRAKRGSPLRGLRCESSAPFSSCAAAAPSGWTPDHSQRGAALRSAPRLRLPTSTTRLGSFSRAFACSFDVGSLRHKPTCRGRCVFWASR